MSWLRRTFSGAYRRARRAEGKGEYREAAALYVEADAPEEAANALLFAAARATELDERLSAYRDALRWLPEDHPRRVEVEGRIGLAILDEAQRRGVRNADERERLADAAERLEKAERWSEAGTAWELLERTEDLARCLQKAGDVERLEALLDKSTESARRERALRRLVSEHEMALAVGARVEARDALRKALALDPDDRALAELLRRLETRFLPAGRLVLRIEERELAFVSGKSVVLGRDADVTVRGTSVSRRHTELRWSPEGVEVRDLGSRNGTLVRGLPIAGSLLLEGTSEVGLGDDVSVRVEPEDGGLRLTILSGLDRDRVVLVGPGALRVPDLPATVRFEGGHPTVQADTGVRCALEGQTVVAPIALLHGDSLEIDGRRLEVP
ncbi:MAG: FHA domain-containing protein [Sandaracinus sp.]|nr:FHA domain-containing protein [Sandaracinus sp.]MCB9632933.1 FHA domain-containing protein [Sandaracinus sp.]